MPALPALDQRTLQLAVMAPLASDVHAFRRRFDAEVAAVYGMSELGELLVRPQRSRP